MEREYRSACEATSHALLPRRCAGSFEYVGTRITTMDSGDQANSRDSTIPIILEKAQSTAVGSDGLYRPRVSKPKVLSLFPLKPDLKPVRTILLKSFSEKTRQPISEEVSHPVVSILSDSELQSRNLDNTAVWMSPFLGQGRLTQGIDLPLTSFKKRRIDQLLVPSHPPSLALIDSVCRESSNAPSLAPYDYSAVVKGHCVEDIGVFVDWKSMSTYQYNGAYTSAVGNSNGAGSALLSRTAPQDASSSTLCPPDPVIAAQLRAQLQFSARHGPRSRSSPFRGVTHYKRTGRWEAHIWKTGKQIYLGASSTAEKAARAYDRAALHFRKMGAALNFKLEDYKGELRQLVEISDDDLVQMLRTQSAGEGTQHPEYPPPTELQHPQPPQAEIRAPTPFTEREKLDQLEPVPDKTQLDPELLPNYVKDDGSGRNLVGQLFRSDQPHSDHPHHVESTLYVPRATHVSMRRAEYNQVIDYMTASLKNPLV